MAASQRILVLDGQSNAALACVRSLGRVGHTVFLASPERRPLAAWSRYCRGCFRHREYSLASYAELRGWARRRGVQIVLPVTERSCTLCNLQRDEWETLGVTIGCGPAEMLDYAFDKARTLQMAEVCGVPIPPTRYPQSLEGCLSAAEELGYPCIVKPRFSQVWDGNALRLGPGVTLAATPEALKAAVLRRVQGDSWPLLQRFVPGSGSGLFALCDRGSPVAWFAQKSLRSVRPLASPNCLRRSVPVDRVLREQAERLLGSFQWHGPAMLEFRDDGRDGPWLMEVNGRFWVSLQLAVDAGVDFPKLWVDLLVGKRPDAPPAYDDEVVLRWLWGDVKRVLGIVLSPPPAGYPAPQPSVRQALRELLGPQPPKTRLEMWQQDDPLPAVGEWVQGLRETVGFLARRRLN